MADLLHVRVVAPAHLAAEVVEVAMGHDGVADVAVLAGAARRPEGDVVLLDVARESINDVLDQLEAMGVAEQGSISVIHAQLTLSAAAERIQGRADGDPDDTIIWDEVSARLHTLVRPSVPFLAFFAVAAVIAAVGIMTDSPILIVGAMVVGPEYGPLAAMAFGLHRRDGRLIGRGVWCFAAGTAVAIVTATVVAVIARATGELPTIYLDRERPLTDFITNPDLFTVLVAVAAAVAGMLALTQDRGGTLVGVLISVTTIPAIAEIGVGLATGHGDEVAGALAQLAINVGAIVVAGVATLAVLQRLGPRRAARRTHDVHLGPPYGAIEALRAERRS